jgi:hypothetical protein
MKAIEEQLLVALRETPMETDCRVSTDTLRVLSLLTTEEQLRWLSHRRPPGNGKRWQLSGQHWNFCAPATDSPAAEHEPVSRTSVRAPAVGRIVVKPLPPLATHPRRTIGE